MPFQALTLFLLIGTPVQVFKSAGAPSKVKPIEGRQVKPKSGSFLITLPKGWFKVDTASKEFQKAVKEGPLKADLNFYKQVEGPFDLMAIDMSQKTSFARNFNVMERKLRLPIRSDRDFQNLFKQISAEPSRKGLKHVLITLKSGPALCYWGEYDGGKGNRNDTVSYVLPKGKNALLFTFSTASGTKDSFRSLSERIMQSLVMK